MRAQNTKMQLSFCAVFVASVCVKLASPVDGQAYGNGHVGKKGTSSSAIHADNDRNGEPPQSCSKEADYEISQNYIIRTKDSKANGANFIVALTVRTFDVCLEQCCLKENCDTTIFVGEAYRSEDTNCFLFECRPEGKGTENRCLFTYHLGYISSMKKALGGFQGFPPDPAPEPVTTVRQIEETTTKPTPPPKLVPIEPVSNCHSGYFECDSGQCINDLYICNSVVDCDDGSDEYRCSPPQDPLPEDQTGPDEEMQTDDQKLSQSLLMPPTNPPNMPNKYPDDASQDGSGPVKGDTPQTLADQLNDQSPLENPDRDESTVQDTKHEDRERELSNMKIRLQDEGGLPQEVRNSEHDGEKNQDQFPELECHGASCYEIHPDGGNPRFEDIQDEEQQYEDGGRGDEEKNRKLMQQDREASPVDTPPRNLEREEYQTGDLRDDYQPPQKPKMPDYKGDGGKSVYDKNTDTYREDEVEDNNGYDLNGRIDDRNDQTVDRGREDRYEANLEDRDASDQRDVDYEPIDRKIVSDHDMGMKHPADVGSIRDDPYRDQDPGRQDHPPPGDGTKDWGFPNNNNPPKSLPPTDEPPRRGISNSEPRLGPGYGYKSDYYSYYYPPYAQTKGRYKTKQTQNNNRPSDRYRQDSYSGRNSQEYNNNPYRGHGTKNDDTNRYDASDNRRYHKVSNIPEDQREEKFPSNDAKIRTGYNSLWNTWPYDYSSSVVDDKVIVDTYSQDIHRNGPSYKTPPKSRPNPKGHNGINALAPPNSLPTSTITLSSIHLAVVTQAPYPINKDVAQQEAVTVMALPQDAVTDGKAEDTGKAKEAGKAEDAGKGNDTKQLTAESNENTDEMVYESRGGSGMPPASSAILPLVIGLVITVVLLLMVGCRLRYMNQRLRYGRLKTSAHDADYLINGMYL